MVGENWDVFANDCLVKNTSENSGIMCENLAPLCRRPRMQDMLLQWAKINQKLWPLRRRSSTLNALTVALL